MKGLKTVFCLVIVVAWLVGTVGWTAPIHDAASKGDVSKVKALLKAKQGLVNAADKDGATPLHYAAGADQKAVVEVLIDNKADINTRKRDGVTALQVAAALGYKDIVELLLANGADASVKDKKGRTALSVARDRGQTEIAALLEAKGAAEGVSEAKAAPIKPKDGEAMVLVPAGEFTMGSNSDDPRESPARKIYVSAFRMDVHEVTYERYVRFLNDVKPNDTQRKEWLRFSGEPQAEFKTGFAYGPKISFENGAYVAQAQFLRYPVAWVTWKGADAYAKWAGESLPSEAQWERAARAGKEGQSFAWGEGPPPPGSGSFCDQSHKKVWPKLSSLADYDDGFSVASPVGIFKSNAFGLYDMDGNVSEWCVDVYVDGWYSRMPDRDPVNLGQSGTHVARGACMNSGAFGPQDKVLGEYRLSARWTPKHTDWDNIGFRCVSPPK
jgi:formylglycine-generating enzyme required for sulfatase activity